MELLKSDICLLGCLPVDCIWNHLYVASVGRDSARAVQWDVTPYKNSQRSHCQVHGGPVWAGPEIWKKKAELERAGHTAIIVICLICVARLEVEGQQELREFST